MLALHALWRTSSAPGEPDAAVRPLALWAEELRGWHLRARLRPSDGPHPFAASSIDLSLALEGAGPGIGWLARGATHGYVRARMPTRGRLPVPSPELCGPGWAHDVAGRKHLETWTMPALLLGAEEAAQLLGELWPSRTSSLVSTVPDDDSEIWLGATLRWLCEVHDLAWRSARTGQVLPSLVEGRARWVPLRDAGLWGRCRELTTAAPPAVRGELDSTASTSELLSVALDSLADAECRLALREEPPFVRPGRAAAPSSPAATEPWLQALTSRDGLVDAPEVEQEVLQRRLSAWHRSTPAPAGPVRACFRLAEPVGPDDADPMGEASDEWTLELLLQPTAEPSVLVPARLVWAGGAALSGILRSTPHARELFEEEVARAVGIYPFLRFALQGERVDELRLTRTEALQFLEIAAPQLTEAGFGILLPSWWGRAAAVSVSLSAHVAQPGAVETRSQLDRDVVVAFDWQAAIGGVRLTEDELRSLAKVGQRLVRVRGQWREVDQAQIAAALAFLADHPGDTTSLGDLLRRTVEEPPAATQFSSVDVESWLGELLSGAAALRVDDVPVPAWFGATLRPYQQRGLDWLHLMTRLGLGAVLADDMGLGKTAQLLALLAVEKDAGRTGPTLVVCPMSLVGNWQREAERFAPHLRVHVHHGSRRLDADGFGTQVAEVDLVITTYGLVQRDHPVLAPVHWRRIVLDEAQQVKNTATQQAKLLRTLSAAHRVALTGTPVENRLADLHAILDQTNPGLFGSPAAFKDRYSAPIERDANATALANLHRLTAPFVLRRSKHDPAIASTLPDKQEMTVLCNLTVEQAGLYRAVLADMLEKMETRRGPSRRGVVLSALTRLKQVCNHPALMLGDGSALPGRSGKLARLEEVLEEVLAEGEKALCFTQYAAFGSVLAPHLQRRLGSQVSFLHGGSSRSERDAMVQQFQSPEGPPVMLLSLKAGGTGLNLTAANHVIHIDRWWNPAVEDQATDRVFRIGQTRDVQVRQLVCIGTIEDRIDRMLEAKRELAGAVNRSDSDWLSDLSTDAVAEFLALSAEAVSEDGSESAIEWGEGA